MIFERVKDVPAPVRRWLEKQEGRKLPATYKVSAYAYSPRGSRKWTEKWERDKRKRDRRLKQVATRMRAVKMSEDDIKTVLDGG